MVRLLSKMCSVGILVPGIQLICLAGQAALETCSRMEGQKQNSAITGTQLEIWPIGTKYCFY